MGFFCNMDKTFLAKKSHSHPDECYFRLLIKELAEKLPERLVIFRPAVFLQTEYFRVTLFIHRKVHTDLFGDTLNA